MSSTSASARSRSAVQAAEMHELERHCRNIAPNVLDGRVVPVLGAGVNLCERPRSARWRFEADFLPNAAELAEHLADQSAYTPDRYKPREPAAEDAPPEERYEPVFDLIRVSQYVEVLKGSVDLYRTLHEVFDRPYKPTVVHRFFAQLMTANVLSAPLVMLSTNYDFALEEAFRAAEIPYDLVTYITDYPKDQRGRFTHSDWEPGQATESTPKVITNPKKYTHVGADRPAIVKVHGAANREGDYRKDNYVISEDDYIDYLMQPNTTNLLPVTIRERLSESHFLFLGYSLRDWNLRVILRRIWEAQWLSTRSWSVRLDADEMEEIFWHQQGVITLRHPLPEYMLALRQACLAAFLDSLVDNPKQRTETIKSSRPEALFEQLAGEDRQALVDELPPEQLEVFVHTLPESRRERFLTMLPGSLLTRLRTSSREPFGRPGE